jgi:hypothetical protein
MYARLIRSFGVLDFAMGSFPFPESRLRKGFVVSSTRRRCYLHCIELWPLPYYHRDYPRSPQIPPCTSHMDNHPSHGQRL